MLCMSVGAMCVVVVVVVVVSERSMYSSRVYLGAVAGRVHDARSGRCGSLQDAAGHVAVRCAAGRSATS
jgi:NADH:ubiquinone oxidoreductase subunit H